MKYLLTLLALTCLYSILITPSEIIERDNANYMRKRARPSMGTQVQQARSIPNGESQRLAARVRIGSRQMDADIWNNTFPKTKTLLPIEAQSTSLQHITVESTDE